MKITQVILFSLFAFASSNPAPDAEHALEARQTYGSCRVTGNRDRLDVRPHSELASTLCGTYTILTQQKRAPGSADASNTADARVSASLASALVSLLVAIGDSYHVV